MIEDKRYLLTIDVDEDSGKILSPKANNRKPSKGSNNTKGSIKGVAVKNRKHSMHSVEEQLRDKIRKRKIETIKQQSNPSTQLSKDKNKNSISGPSFFSNKITVISDEKCGEFQ